MATAGDIITAAFIKAGVENPSAAQSATALITLNNMISMWGCEGLIYTITEEAFSLDANINEYTIGPTGRWVTTRPLHVLSCFLRTDDNMDRGITIYSGKDYDRIHFKSAQLCPSALYYLSEYPDAKIIFNTWPDVGYDGFFRFLKNFTEFAAATDDVVLPAEYKEALVYSLTVGICEDWDRPIGRTVLINADRTKEAVLRLIASQRVIPESRFEPMGVKVGSGIGYSGSQDRIVDGGV